MNPTQAVPDRGSDVMLTPASDPRSGLLASGNLAGRLHGTAFHPGNTRSGGEETWELHGEPGKYVLDVSNILQNRIDTREPDEG